MSATAVFTSHPKIAEQRLRHVKVCIGRRMPMRTVWAPGPCARRSDQEMFRFLLRLPDGEPPDPAPGFVTAVPEWNVGDTFLLPGGERFRILAIQTEIAQQLLDAGFNAVFVVEPL